MSAGTQPSIEVALPFFGTRRFLEEAVESVRRQRDPAWLLRVRDDNPTPDPDVARWLAGLGDDRIEYRANDRNLGVSANFNRCLDDVTSDYVVLMGCDDRMLDTYVGSARAALRRAPEPVAVYQPQVRVVDGDGRPVMPMADRLKTVLRPRAHVPRALAGEKLAQSLMRGVWTYFPSLLWNVEALAGRRFDENVRVVQDARLLMDLVLDDAVLYLDNDVTFEYRRHAEAASSVTLAGGERFAEERDFYSEYATRLEARNWGRAASAARWHATSRLHAIVLAGKCIQDGKLNQSARLLRGHVLSG